MNTLQILNNKEFGQMRAIEIDGKIYFGATDSAKALGYKNPSDAISTHCKKDGVANHEVIDSIGRTQKTNFITEGNLYRLISKSKLPTADQFEEWVFDEVLPSIRQNGAYIPNATVAETQKIAKQFKGSIYLTEEIHDKKSMRKFIRNYNIMELDECIYKIVDMVAPMKGSVKHDLIDVAIKELKAIDSGLMKDTIKNTYVKDTAIQGIVVLQDVKIGKFKKRISQLSGQVM